MRFMVGGGQYIVSYSKSSGREGTPGAHHLYMRLIFLCVGDAFYGLGFVYHVF